MEQTLRELDVEHGSDLVHAALGVLVPGFTGTQLPEWAAAALDRGLGGLFLFGHNVSSPAEVRRLAEELHAMAPAALLASDEEGGTVTRLQQADGSDWPGHRALGQIDDVVLTRSVAAEMGAWLRNCGIDMVAAPVLDVDDTVDNPVIGVRSFGGDPALVTRHGRAFAAGLDDAGLIACAKHFPGHGATHTDSHLGVPTVADDLATVWRRDLAPFAAMARTGIPAIMSAHVIHQALAAEPATLSPETIGLLREDLGFDGVVCSDALDMHAISRGVGRRRGAVLALSAGVDLLCLGNPQFPEPYDAQADTAQMVAALCEAVREGQLSAVRLEEAAQRVRSLGARRSKPTVDADGGGSGPAELGLSAARGALQVTGELPALAGGISVRGSLGRGNIAAGTRSETFIRALEESLGSDDVRASAALHLLVTDDSTDPACVAWEDVAVVVHTGCRELERPDGLAQVRTFGGGRASGVAAGELLAGRGPHRRR